ncbi:EKC/KEOPS complex subunit GON7 [Saccopteryx bilineata]|uniref:EKC/KEOPS complex subunit GON7 n=1 Tax=Saccopteryx bilineata TaxID=59482 RepID=UPI00338E59C0
MEVLAEYVGLDGQTQQLRVLCDAPRDADPYEGLLAGVAQMRDLVAELFSPQVQQGAQGGVAVATDEALDGDDEDDAEDENNIDNRTNSEGPSDAKRPKPPSIS